jgi:hypothetical protein
VPASAASWQDRQAASVLCIPPLTLACRLAR